MEVITLKTLPGLVEASQIQRQNGISCRLALSYCPSMDLIATYPKLCNSENANIEILQQENEDFYDETEETEPVVDVYRFNGQKVFSVTIESERRTVAIVDVAWRNDGVFIAILSSDCVIRLVNSFSGKIVHKFSTCSSYTPQASVIPLQGLSPGKQPKSPSSKRHSTTRLEPPKKRRCLPASLSYTTHFLDVDKTRQSIAKANKENGLVLDDLLGLNVDLNKMLRTKADLPKAIANIDTEPFLPKLSTLPVGSLGDEEVFSNRTSIDTMFHPIKSPMKAGAVEILLTGHDDGTVHMRIFDSFEVGDIDLNRASQMPPGLNLKNVQQLVGHHFTRKVFVIAEEEDNGPTATHTRSHGDPNIQGKSLHMLSLDSRFIQQSSYHLPILVTKSTQLNNLIRYLSQIEKQLSREIKTAFDLPVRYLRSINGDLAENENEACTFETVAYHAIVTGEVHSKLKEWLAEVVGDRGVKRWEKAVGDCLDLVRRLISECWNPAVERAAIVISRLTGLVKANTKGTVGINEDVITALRNTIDVMAIVGEDILREVGKEIFNFSLFIKWLKWEVEAASLEDTSERLDEMRESNDHAEVMTVLKYISEGLHESKVKKFLLGDGSVSAATVIAESVDFYTQIKEMRRKEADQIFSLTVSALLQRLSKQCEQLFEQIADTLRKGVLVQYVSKLPSNMDGSGTTSRIIPMYNSDNSSLSLHMVTAGKHQHKTGSLVLFTISTDGKITERTSEYSIEATNDILDIKFASDSELLVLTKSEDERAIFGGNPTDPSEWVKLHSFSRDKDELLKAGMQAGSLEVNGRKRRRAVAVVDANGRGYGVFDLDSGDVEEHRDVDEDEVMTG